MTDSFDKLGGSGNRQSVKFSYLEVDILLPNREEDAREALYRVWIEILLMLRQDPLLDL